MQKRLGDKIQRMDKNIDRTRMRRKDSDTLKVTENVFDDATLKTLYNLSNKGIIEAMGGSISTGKEANVFIAEGKDQELAVKIYRMSSSTFRAMEDYILGDSRFLNIRHNKRDIIFAWTKKELRNLIRAKKAGVKVPQTVTSERNILVMEFLGREGVPYPLLKDVEFDSGQARQLFDIIISYMQALYKNAHLIHGDLSEYNIVLDPQNMIPFIIDMGQSVTLDHPKARDFLERDVLNIVRYFKRFNIDADPKILYMNITS